MLFRGGNKKDLKEEATPFPSQLLYMSSEGAVEFSTGAPIPQPAQSYSLDLCCSVSIATPPASYRRASHWQTKLRTALTDSLNNGCPDWKKGGAGRQKGAFPGSPDSGRKSLAWHQQGALAQPACSAEAAWHMVSPIFP